MTLKNSATSINRFSQSIFNAQIPLNEEFMESKLKIYYFKRIDHFELRSEMFVPNDGTYQILERAIHIWFEPDEETFEVTLKPKVLRIAS